MDTSREIWPLRPVVKDGLWDVAEELPLGVSIMFEITDEETHVLNHVQSLMSPPSLLRMMIEKREVPGEW